MRLLSLTIFAPVALALLRRDGNGYGNLPYCPLQSTTVTCTKTNTLAPATRVTTIQGECTDYFTSTTATQTQTDHVQSTVTNYIPPSTTITAAPTSTLTQTVAGPTVTVCKKKSGDDNDQGQNNNNQGQNNNNQRRDWASLSNAERLQRGLPLRMPVHRRGGDGGKPPQNPSCKPTTTTIRPTVYVDYQTTVVQTATTCATEWINVIAHETATVTDVSTTTKVDTNLPYHTITVPAQYPATKTVTTHPTTTIKCRTGGGNEDDQGQNNNNQGQNNNRQRRAHVGSGYGRKRAAEIHNGRA